MYSQNQVRDLIVIGAEATEGNVKAFLSTASPLEARVLTGDGSKVPDAKGKFKVFAKHVDGTLKVSEVIDANKVTSYTKTAPKTEVAKSVAITIPTGIVTGETLSVRIVLNNWGSLSFDNQYFKYGYAQKFSTDSPEDLANKLMKSLSKSFMREEPSLFTATEMDNYATSKSIFATTAAVVTAKATLVVGENIQVGTAGNAVAYKVISKTATTFAAIATELGAVETYSLPDNPLFTFTKTNVAGVIGITVTEKAQPYLAGKKQGRNLVFEVTNSFGPQVLTDIVTNPCSGKSVRSLEWFCKGNTGDVYREMGHPFNIDPAPADAKTDVSYYMINLNYYGGDGLAHAVQKSPRQLQIAVETSTEANKIITDLNAATGIVVTNF